MNRLPSAASALLALSLPAQATVTVVPCLADTTLYQDATGSLANGGGSSLFAGANLTGLAA